MSTDTALVQNALWPTPEIDARRRERPARRRRLAICPADYREMSHAADIIRSTADWYRPFLDPKDMSEHDIGPEWIDENYDRRDFYLGWHGSRPVGVLSTQEAGDHLYLGYVYVHEDETGNGYGRELLEFARKRARLDDRRGLALIAHPDAEWATKAYRRFGFEKIADRREEVLAWNDGWLSPYYEEGFQLYELRV